VLRNYLACSAAQTVHVMPEEFTTQECCSAFAIRHDQLVAAAPSRYPALSEAQHLKLKQLTVASIASHTKVCCSRCLRLGSLARSSPPLLASPCCGDVTRWCVMQTIPYDDLQQQLEISSLRELEDLIITHCFYPQLVKGKLDQKQHCLQVHQPFHLCAV